MSVNCLADRVILVKSSGVLGVDVSIGAQKLSTWVGTAVEVHCFQPTPIQRLKQLLNSMANELGFRAANWTLGRNGISASNEERWEQQGYLGLLKKEVEG